MYDITIWTPINSESGFGHFYRMLGLYEKLLEEKIDVSYFTNDDYIVLNNVNVIHNKTEKIDEIIKFLQNHSIKIIVIDNYDVNQHNIKILNKFFKIIYFDAKFENPETDVIINFNPFSVDKYHKKNPNTEYFLGLEHMIYRKELKDVKDVKVNMNEIFISIGGSDIEHITYKLLTYLSTPMHYNIILGKGCSLEYYHQVATKLKSLGLKYSLYQQPNNYFELLARSEFAIISCSTTVYEVSYFAKAFIAINVVKNQNILEKYLTLHKIDTLPIDKLEQITDIIENKRFKILRNKNIWKENKYSLFQYIKKVLNEK